MIETKRVDAGYGKDPAIVEASVEVRPGELVALIGRNGSGKSTLLRVLSGSLRPSCGEVCLDGRRLDTWGVRELSMRRSFLPQRPALHAAFKVREVVQLGLSPHRLGLAAERALVEEALTWVGMRHFAERRYDQLSGGERQRVQLARAAIQVWPAQDAAAGYLLLDEPTSAQDLAQVQHLLARVRQLVGMGVGAVVVLHDLSAALAFADRTIVLSRGRVVASGPPLEVLSASLLREHFGLRARVVTSAGSLPVVVPNSPELGAIA